ncbi:hypothetical protein WJX72_004558 [[Myrmecia] bisecta]|uniref:Ubiquitin thioesterase OTU n=1 Tax=[Myrmecia] bisecta TaxID=41462 RepID=A0AAW1QEX1_9CHLO
MGRNQGDVRFACSPITLPADAVLQCPVSSSLPQFQLQRSGWGAVSNGLASLSTSFLPQRKPVALFSLARVPATAHGAERTFRVAKVKPDGRCMFRALAKGLAHNKGSFLSERTEEEEADWMRMAVQEALCTSEKRRKDFKDAVFALETEDTLPGYCRRLKSAGFWGGNVELLVLSKMLKVPIIVYQTAAEQGRHDAGFVPIVKYGEEWAKSSKQRKARRPVRLLYTNGNHYDLLL